MLKLALRNPITGVLRALEAAAQTHAATHDSGNPITGVPRAREAAAQTHSCAGILTARAQTNWRPAIRSRECRARGRLQHKP